MNARVTRLREEIRRHDHLYYVLDRPEVADSQYDALFRELVRLEAEHPELADEASPTRRVPGAVAEGFAAFRHPVPMVSLTNVTSEEEFLEWEDGLHSFLNLPEGTTLAFSTEPKIDGISLELVYEGGRLVAAATRGDGTEGEDVTANVRTLRSIPLSLRGEAPRYVAVRGEAYVRKADFVEFNRRLTERGEETFANPRNFCAGSLRQVDPSIPASRPIRYLAYSIAKVEGRAFATQNEVLSTLRAWGFPTSDRNAVLAGAPAVAARFAETARDRDAVPFEIDGMVVKVDDMALQARLGMRTRSPRWAVAWKFPSRRGVSPVREIWWSVGRTGAVTPVAVIDPVEVGGVTITNVGLFNPGQLQRLDVRAGDRIVVERAGDVIPYVVGVAEGGRTGDPKKPVPPSACPVCGTPLVQGEKAVLRCPNAYGCAAQVQGRIEHFFSRGGLDVMGLGPKQVAQFLAAGLVKDPADFFALKKDDVVALERQGETSATNLVTRLDAAKRPPLDRFLFALAMPEVGESGARTLARAFPTLAALRDASVEALDDLDEVGPAMAQAVHGWFHEPKNSALLDKLLAAGVAPQPPAAAGSGPLSGQTVVFTGTLPTLSRDEAKHLAEAAGARIAASISAKTTVVVAGDAAGSKLKKAKELGVEVVDEAEFLRRAGRGS